MAETPRLRTLRQAIAYFSNRDRCLELAVRMRWRNGVACPTCGSQQVTFLSTRQLWKCKQQHPQQQFSVKVGTIFEDSPIGLDKWFGAIWMVANHPEEVTALDLARDLQVSQKTAAHMIHRIQLAMNTGTFEKIAYRKDRSSRARIFALDSDCQR